MYARVTAVQGSPDKVDAGIDSFNKEVLPVIKGLDDYRAAFLLVDRNTGKGYGISFWESEDARTRAGEAIAKARESTIQAMGGTVPPVEELEVASADL